VLRPSSCASWKDFWNNFGRANFALFKDLLGRVLWDEALEGRGAQKNWLVFTDHLLQAQEPSIPMNRRSGKNTRKPPRT